MSDQFVAEIRIVPFDFAPRGWATCDGQILPIGQNTALFSLLGATYGGDGKTVFGLPNFEGSAPMQQGQGQGLSPRSLGESGGAQTVTLRDVELPAHSHTAQGYAGAGGQGPANNTAWSDAGQRGISAYAPSSANNAQMSPQALSVAGGGQPHNNMMRYLGLMFIIALQGIYPPRA